MGSPKHLLHLVQGEPIYASLINRCRQAGADISGVYLSLRDRSQLAHLGDASCQDACVTVLYDSETPLNGARNSDIGPAAGLLAAYREDRTSHWLVIACDYPLITSREIAHLIRSYQAPVTCFMNGSGWPEPLLAVWSSAALARLEANVAQGIEGPKTVLRDLRGSTIAPLDERTLLNANTREDWETAVKAAPAIDIASQSPPSMRCKCESKADVYWIG